MIKVGIIGCGHWGPNHVRIFSQMSGSQAVMCADLDEERLAWIKSSYPQIATTKNYQDIIQNKDIDAVVVATPTDTHFSIVGETLRAGKHVLCEKPLTLHEQECLELKKLAESKKTVLMVGHVFVFNAGILKLKEYIQNKELGRIYYAHSTRTNLGPFRYDVNAIWDLAPHDISIFNYLFDSLPLSVSASGQKYLGTPREDLAFATLAYPGDILANVHVSWLDPKKIRQITIVGDEKMVVWDDLDSQGPIKLYDKHVEKKGPFYQTYGEFQLLSRVGSITIPNIGINEPLKAQNEYFLNCIAYKQLPVMADAQKGADVVKSLQAIQQSVEQKGAPVKIGK